MKCQGYVEQGEDELQIIDFRTTFQLCTKSFGKIVKRPSFIFGTLCLLIDFEDLDFFMFTYSSAENC